MNFYKTTFIVILLSNFLSNILNAQVNLSVTVNSGSSSTTCTDGTFGGTPEPHWRVEIENQGYTTYPSSGICFTDAPNEQYNQNFNCASDYPATLNVCFRAFEDDGATCIVSESCLEQICQNFSTPTPGSSVTYNLSVNGASSGTVNFTITSSGAFLNDNTVDTRIACDSLVWIDGNTYYTSNNTATHTLTNSSGCDSTVTLDLTINNANFGTDTQTACDSLTWIDGNTYYTSNNTATHTLTNSSGCDSIVTLDLTINNANFGTDTQTACDSLTWIDGNTYYASNNTATHTLTNSNGCDSTVTLDLTIFNTDYTVTQSGVNLTANQSGATYQWIDCADDSPILNANDQTYVATENGDYAVIVSNNGCLDTSICHHVNSVGILENNFKSEMNIYPNPTKGNLTIDMEEQHQLITITLSSLNGKAIQSKTYKNSQILNLEMGDIAPGIYLLTIQSKNEKAVVKIMKK